jgi:predicted nucleotidyltransferase component of viral defense system
VQIDWDGPSGTGRYSILSLQEIVKAKLAAYYQRESTNDYLDLVWMCQNLGARVRTFSNRLDQDQREYFFEAFSESGTASNREINEFRRILNL